MTRAVIDTNVLLVANGDHEDASEDCAINCLETLETIRTQGIAVIDSDWRIIREYQDNIPTKGQPGPGQVFLKWLLQRRATASQVVEVALTENSPDRFEEFPDKALEPHFDPPDRKFVAVAAADGSATIKQAVDCKWLDWWQQLSQGGVTVHFLCPDDVCRYYRNKFNISPPHLPEP